MPRRKKQKDQGKDPYQTREASRYENPIPSREHILDYMGSIEGLPNFDQIANDLGLSGERDLAALAKRLGAMQRDGQVLKNRRGAFGIVGKLDLIKGRIVGHPDGYGFVISDEGGNDIFLPHGEMRTVMHGDRVLVRAMQPDHRGKIEGKLVEVLERANQTIVGLFYVEKGMAFVRPSNTRIATEISIESASASQASASKESASKESASHGQAQTGQLVVVEIIGQPSRHKLPIGRVIEVLGNEMAPGMEIEVAIRMYELPHTWSQAVKSQVAAMPEDTADEDISNREDIRHLPLVTIDGDDARDFDDGVFCEPKGKGWRLIVAIADVSHYVSTDSALDQEAVLRGNSVYFPQQVIPMLPEKLSNGLCSLKPLVDRLCLCCEMTISANGQLTKYRFFEGVMHSHARLTYDQVAAILDGNEALIDKFAPLVPHLEHLHGLYLALAEARGKRGAIDFDRAETKILFGEDRKIKKIMPMARNDAHRMIEECMIAANISAAKYLHQHEMPALSRVHPAPEVTRLENLHAFLKDLGLKLAGGESPAPSDYALLLASVRDRADRHLIETVVLRSLSQARYSPEEVGHFGLALDAYMHFTSPIRRYPDLLVHRAIRHVLRGQKKDQFHYSALEIQRLGEQCSLTERRADEATRDVTEWLKCEYMLDHVGSSFDGVITSVTAFGLFVELDEVYVEGLVHITALDNDYYHYDGVAHRLVGESTNNSYQLGGRLRVQVAKVDLDGRKIDFVLEGAKSKGSKSSKGKKPGRKTGRKGGRRKGAKAGTRQAKAGRGKR